jgi:hypothetical protein
MKAGQLFLKVDYNAIYLCKVVAIFESNVILHISKAGGDEVSEQAETIDRLSRYGEYTEERFVESVFVNTAINDGVAYDVQRAREMYNLGYRKGEAE